MREEERETMKKGSRKAGMDGKAYEKGKRRRTVKGEVIKYRR